MTTYNGHKNWNRWNISLWINNDQGLYGLAKDCIERASNRTQAARMMLDYLRSLGTPETLDGAPFSVTTIRAAMADM